MTVNCTSASCIRARGRSEEKMENEKGWWWWGLRWLQTVEDKLGKKPERARAEEEEEMRRIRWGRGQEALSLSVSRMGEKKSDWRESQRRRRGRSKRAGEAVRACVCAWGLSEAFINESRCLALWTCRVADGDGGDGALDSPDGYHSLSSSCLLNCLPHRSEDEREKDGETELEMNLKKK